MPMTPMAKPEDRPGTRLHPLDRPGYDKGLWHVPRRPEMSSLAPSTVRKQKRMWRRYRCEQATSELRSWLRRIPGRGADFAKEPGSYRYWDQGRFREMAAKVDLIAGTDLEEEYAERKAALKERWALGMLAEIGPKVPAEDA